ncbi:CHAT domain-containing protein [Streptomyces lunaelactis]|uniref:CHAT domain-containing protein n=1 Tax=Streptomyces lunaelactis TaxID=1535768 RepID=UPI0015858BA7|nr:CHAT domain-containing protein [Streptomyces lunaelactis]NUK21974.1 CHAT domain-containing protein [Streptomyces lunaelactis]
MEQHEFLLLNDYADKALSAYQSHIEANLDKMPSTGATTRWMIQCEFIEMRHLLKRCRVNGIAAAFAEKDGKLAGDWILEFISFISFASRAGNWVDIKNALESNSDLLSRQARQFLSEAEGLQAKLGENEISLLQLLDEIHSRGIDAAFADLVEFGTDVPRVLRPELRGAVDATKSYHDTGDRISLNEAIVAWESVVRHPAFGTSSFHTQYTYLAEAADAYEHKYRECGELDDLERSIKLLQQFGETEFLRAGHESAEALHYLGVSYERNYRKHLSEAEKWRVENAPESAKHYERAHIALKQAIHNYEKAYDAANEATEGVLPAPVDTEGGSDAFSKLMWLRRQKSRYLNAAGLAYEEGYRLTRDADDLHRAVEKCRSAAEISEQEELNTPFLYDDLAGALATRYQLIGHQADLQDAVTAFERSLEGCDDVNPLFGLESATHYGLFLHDLEDYKKARSVLQVAHSWAEKTRSERASQKDSMKLAAYTATLYRTLVSCCLEDGDERSAFLYASASKGRTFVDRLARAQVTVEGVLRDHPEIEHLDRYVQVRNAICHLRRTLYQRKGEEREDEAHSPASEEQAYSHLSPGEVIGEIKRRLFEERLLWEDLSSRYRSLAAIENSEPPLNATDARILAGELEATLVEFYEHREGWCAFVVTSERIEYRPLPDLNDDLLRRLGRWIANFDSLGRREMEKLLTEWHTAALRPLLNDLRSARVAILAPFGAMHAVPFGAAMDRETKRFLIDDDYEFGFTSSLAALRSIWQRHRKSAVGACRKDEHRVLAVAYPGTPGPEFLTNAVHEAKDVRGYFPGSTWTLLSEADATPEAVIAKVAEQDVIHLSCHGFFDSAFPAQSGLALSSGWLTVRRVLTELRIDREALVTLSACETARSGLAAGDELAGMTQAILTAGARCVVSSLWRANEQATGELFATFYKYVANGVSPIQAMREAAIAVRSHEEWKHPRYWCPFIVVGLGTFALPHKEIGKAEGKGWDHERSDVETEGEYRRRDG